MKSFLISLVMIVALAIINARIVHPAAAAPRPNILFILTDDQRWDAMGCAGNRIIQTPNMNALAREGVRFTNMFVTTPICPASRASILTGLHERTHRFTFGTPPIADEHTDRSYPALLKRAGYRTGFVGKFGVNVKPGGTQRMFDYFVPLDRNPYFKRQPDGTERHLTDLECDRALAFLDTVKPGESFCLSVSFNAPHAEDNDPKQYFWPHSCDELYRDAVIPVPKTMTDEFFNQQPDFLRNSESRVRFNWRFDEPRKYQEMVKGYYRMISGVDMAIARLRAELQRRGLADNTVIIFTSDNGYFLGDRGFADKWYIYEPSIRVPLIVCDPRAPRSRHSRVAGTMALNIDLAPTMLEFAGLEVPKSLQGNSLLPLLDGKKPRDWRTDFFFEHLFERKNIPKSEGVRTERFSYVRWFEQKPLVEELYDHLADFDEMRNLVSDAKYADILAKLRKRTDELRDQYGGPFVPNAIAPARKPEPQRLIIIGDSTVCDYPDSTPTRGWGQFIQGYFKDTVKVVNLAKSGRSTKTFIKEGLWDQALKEKTGFVLIQFGHNDSHASGRPESTDAATDFKDYLRRYVDDARSISATPILVTPMHRRTFAADGKLNDSLRPYADAMKEVAAEKKVSVIGLHAMSGELFSKLGDEGSADLSNQPGDRTHFSAKGAMAMAALVMRELAKLVPQLKMELKLNGQ